MMREQSRWDSRLSSVSITVRCQTAGDSSGGSVCQKETRCV